MAYATDNRWSPGNGIAADHATAVYSARWVDQGYDYPFDVLPDRQGFAYNDAADRDALIELLNSHRPRNMQRDVAVMDEWQNVINDGQFHVRLRRFGGYCYCEAWIEPITVGEVIGTLDEHGRLTLSKDSITDALLRYQEGGPR